MNERIKLLADQVKKYALDAMIKITDKEQALKVYSETYDTKFAELIVRECIEQGDTLAKHYIDTHPEQEQVMLLASIADYSNVIKKHFGVEE